MLARAWGFKSPSGQEKKANRTRSRIKHEKYLVFFLSAEGDLNGANAERKRGKARRDARRQ